MRSIKNETKIIERFKTFKKIQKFVVEGVSYVPDTKKGYNDWWQWPQETLDFDSGDCEDMAILMISLAYQFLGQRLKLVILKDRRKNIYHAVVEFDGKWYDSVQYVEINKDHKTWKRKRTIPFWWINCEIRIRRFISKLLWRLDKIV